MPVQRGGGDADACGDRLHADTVVTEGAERFGRRAGDLLLPVRRPTPDVAAIAGRTGARHGQHHTDPGTYTGACISGHHRRRIAAGSPRIRLT